MSLALLLRLNGFSKTGFALNIIQKKSDEPPGPRPNQQLGNPVETRRSGYQAAAAAAANTGRTSLPVSLNSSSVLQAQGVLGVGKKRAFSFSSPFK